MSNSNRSHLSVFSDDPGVVDLKVLDSQFQEVAQGREYLSVELPPGIYQVEATAGFQSWTGLVALRPGTTEDVRVPPFELQSSAPLYESKYGHEYHEMAAYAQSRKVHAIVGHGGSIFIMVRYFSPNPSQPDKPTTHPMRGLSLHNAAGELLVDLQSKADYQSPDQNPYEPDPWAACCVCLDPGYYRLRQELPTGKVIEMPLIAAQDWQLQLFALLTRTGRSDPSMLRANLPAAYINYTPFNPQAPQSSQGFQFGDQQSQVSERLTELARQSLMSRTPVVSQQLRDMIAGKFENPMLGILSGHLMLLQQEPNLDTLEFVVKNLRRMLGDDHPDVNALAVALEQRKPQHGTRWGQSPNTGASFYVCDRPPMLRESWQVVLQASITRPDIVPHASLASDVAASLWGEGIWMFWNAPRPAAEVTFDLKGLDNEVLGIDDLPSAPELTSHEKALKSLLIADGVEAGSLSRQEANGPAEIDEDTAQRLVYALGVPRGNVEVMLQKLAQQGQTYEETRRSMRSGPERTRVMAGIIAEIRAMSTDQQEVAAKALRQLSEEDSDGSRISAIGLLQALPDPDFLPFLLDCISRTRSPFEQFQALYASYKLLPLLNEDQKLYLKRCIEEQRGILPWQIIKPGSDRWMLSSNILKQLE